MWLAPARQGDPVAELDECGVAPEDEPRYRGDDHQPASRVMAQPWNL